jgi:hypothetical protein
MSKISESIKQHSAELRVAAKNKREGLGKLADGLTITILAGSASDPVSRSLIRGGFSFSLLGAASLAGSAISGVVGPTVMGFAIIPTLSKAMVVGGLAVLTAGFIRGFREGYNHATQQEVASKTVMDLLATLEQKVQQSATPVSETVEDILAGLDIPDLTDADIVSA